MAGSGPRVRALRPGDPRALGSYEIVGRLGEGGMGSVYLANAADGRQVAVKVIKAELADDVDFRRRFRQEVDRAAQVPPFCTAEVLDADTDHDPPYLVVEYVDGPSLSEVVAERGPLTPANQHGIALGVAVALTAIHGAGVIHRDLKPANVLLAPGSPKVIDFGIARAAAASDFDTATNEILGTVAYMAPERFGPDARSALTPAADVFAWGTIVAFAATGRTPFAADSPGEVAVRIMTEPPNLDGLSGRLRDLVERSLAKDPADRPTSRDLVDSLLAGSDRMAVGPAAFVEQPSVLAAAGIGAPGDENATTMVNGTTVVNGPGVATRPTVVNRPADVNGPTVVRNRVPVQGPPRAPGPQRIHQPPRPQPPPHLRQPPPPRVQPGPRVQPPPVAAPEPRRGRGTRAALVALTVAVLLLAGAVVAIWKGNLGGLVAAESNPTGGTSSPARPEPTTQPAPTSAAPTPTSAPTVTPTPIPSLTPSASAGPRPTIAPGSESLVSGSFGNWVSSTDDVNQGSCKAAASQLTVTLTSATTRSFRCRATGSVTDSLTDFTVKVDVTVANANSCGGIWFHYSDAGFAGYALMVCSGRYELITHSGKEVKSVMKLFEDQYTQPGTPIHVGIQTVGNRVWFYRDNLVSSEITANDYTAGRVVLGVFPATTGAEPPYQATFTNVNLWKAPTS